MDKKLKQILIISAVVLLYALVFIFYILGPLTIRIEDFIRFFALFGLLSLLISSIMAAFTREIYQIFGKPFKTVHHFIALFGLGMIILHPVLFVIQTRNPMAFVPDFTSWISFWVLAGRPALYLIILAVVAGFLQKRIKKWWRYIHAFNYIAVVFGVIHGLLIGSNLSTSIALKIIYIILLIAVAAAFAMKRYQFYMKKKQLKERLEKKTKETEET
jgi:predicted ferric reductase